MTAYYNENDPYAAEWLRNLVTAGQRNSVNDPRHLWPVWFGLIAERNPRVVFGEQVASTDGYAWLDIVFDDLEAMRYAFAPLVLPAAGFGAPHGRHRIYFVANTSSERRQQISRSAPGDEGKNGRRAKTDNVIEGDGSALRLEHADSAGNNERPSSGEQPLCDERCEVAGAVEFPESEQARISRLARERRATSGYWRNADWIPCRGEKWRAIEPGTFPLAHGVASRMDKIRAYGNAICAPEAIEFVSAYMDTVQTGLDPQ